MHSVICGYRICGSGGKSFECRKDQYLPLVPLVSFCRIFHYKTCCGPPFLQSSSELELGVVYPGTSDRSRKGMMFQSLGPMTAKDLS